MHLPPKFGATYLFKCEDFAQESAKPIRQYIEAGQLAGSMRAQEVGGYVVIDTPDDQVLFLLDKELEKTSRTAKTPLLKSSVTLNTAIIMGLLEQFRTLDRILSNNMAGDTHEAAWDREQAIPGFQKIKRDLVKLQELLEIRYRQGTFKQKEQS
jgi:hypothetical protein